MEITRSKLNTPVAITGIFFVAVFVGSFAMTPLALAASTGSDYPLEIIRAHTAYLVEDPSGTVPIGLGVRGDR